MFDFFRKKKSASNDDMVNAIVTQTQALIQDLNIKMDLRFKEVSSQIRELELGLAQMETRLLTKDLKDKQAYGLLHYKLHESKSVKLESDLDELKEQINFRNKLKDL
jgi:hypothetical protein